MARNDLRGSSLVKDLLHARARDDPLYLLPERLVGN